MDVKSNYKSYCQFWQQLNEADTINYGLNVCVRLIVLTDIRVRV